MDITSMHYIKSNYKALTKEFWRHSNRLYAMRATISMALVSVPFIIIGKPYFGVTLALGALAAALSETDDHPKGRIKALSLTVLSFFVSSIAVGLLSKITWLLGAGFILSTILFILIGGIGERYRAITFGSILIGIYAMLGSDISPAWYWQAILLPGGALFHGLLSLFLLYKKPWRLLDEQMARGFMSLSQYLEKKALLFPSKREEQESINRELALLNISLVNALEKIKEVLLNYDRELNDSEQLRPYLQRFMLLQSLHERAASSHERHDKLSYSKETEEVMEGFGEMLRQLAYATKQVAENMLTGSSYKHPITLDWISKAIEGNLENMEANQSQALSLLHHNLHRSHISLKYLDNIEQGTSIPRLRKDERTAWQRLKAQLTFGHPRMLYAIRLSISFLIGFALVHYFDMKKGEWIMLTSLFVSQISYTATRRRLFQRLLGTVTGVIIGILLLQVFTSHAAQTMLMLGSAMAFFYWLRINYSRAVIFITIFVISAFNLISKDGGFTIMVPRLIDTLIGASISFLVMRFLWPDWQYRRMPELINKAMHKNLRYLQAIIESFKSDNKDDLNYRIARREAHLADNELATAWSSMRMEPKSKQVMMRHALKLTYLNHALLSYISALGAHKEASVNSIEELREVTNLIKVAIQQAGEYLLNDNPQGLPDLSGIVMDLKQQVNQTQLVGKKQQLRLFYNILSTTSKIIVELNHTPLNLK